MVYQDERNTFYREYEDRSYNIISFFLSYLTLEIPFEFVAGLVSTLFLLITGFPSMCFVSGRLISQIRLDHFSWLFLMYSVFSIAGSLLA